MCAISGVLLRNDPDLSKRHLRNMVRWLVSYGTCRGRDAAGVTIHYRDGRIREWVTTSYPTHAFPPLTKGDLTDAAAILINNRAEPTTEYVATKSSADVQPYTHGTWTVAHNGTIANDADVRDSFDLQPPTQIDSAVLPGVFAAYQPATVEALVDPVLSSLIGSYALAAHDSNAPDRLHLATNYKPLHLYDDSYGVWFASLPEMLREHSFELQPFELPAYTALTITAQVAGFQPDARSLLPPPTGPTLVICSGGLDSTVVAASLKAEGHDVHLLHFDYGARATSSEAKAIDDIAAYLETPVVRMDIASLFAQIGGSPLTNTSDAINREGDGIAGAEFAFEWVPARNTVMLAIATAYAEAHGYAFLATGANLEESGAYPDNEPEFLRRFQHLLPYVTGPDADVRLLTPVGNLMKHEIVELGHRVGAPIGLSWSCYDDGPVHCGKCGPCYMRRTAHLIHDLTDPTVYETELDRVPHQ